jgi:hypothetical protein
MEQRGILLVALVCCLPPAAWAKGPDATASTTAEGTRTLPGGAVLKFSSDAKYEMGKGIKLALAPSGTEKTPVHVIKLTAGRVSITIPESKSKVPPTAVLVQAPRRVSAVAKGGESLVITTSERVTVAAVKGDMLAALGNDWKPLPGGLVRSFGGGVTTEQPVPAAPSLRVDSGMLMALGGTATTQLRATADKNVERRELVLYRVEGNNRAKLKQMEWRDEAQQLPAMTPGRYEVRARAIDRFGVEGPMSAPLAVRVIGAELPDGARLVGDTILLGRTGRVKLIGAEGLESSYGRASVFVPAPKDVGLARGDSTLLRLRVPGTKEELGIKLEPRSLRADVAIGPKTARWPGEALQIQVKLFDHRGKPVTDNLKTKPRVFVNVEQVEPTWTHSGNTYTAKVAPKGGAGPWVVRVEVNDDFGEQVGRDFIELGGSTAQYASQAPSL